MNKYENMTETKDANKKERPLHVVQFLLLFPKAWVLVTNSSPPPQEDRCKNCHNKDSCNEGGDRENGSSRDSGTLCQ